jgi:hypothetical protein
MIKEKPEEQPVFVDEEHLTRYRMHELTRPHNLMNVAQWIGIWKIEPNPYYLFRALNEAERLTGLDENTGYLKTKEGAIILARRAFSAAGRAIEVFNEKRQTVTARDIIFSKVVRGK